MFATDTLVNDFKPIRRVSPIVFRINAKILERNPVSQPTGVVAYPRLLGSPFGYPTIDFLHIQLQTTTFDHTPSLIGVVTTK